jgi:alanyl-tRNA synthetase
MDEANRIVWEDRPVTVRFVSEEEAAALPLRKEPARGGTLRLVEVADFDLSACGGTHVARTGASASSSPAGAERFRGGSRLQFLCGVRVRRRFDLWRDALAATMKHLSVVPEELAGRGAAAGREQGGLQRALRAAQEKLAVVRGAGAGRPRHTRGAIVWSSWRPAGPRRGGLKAMAAAAAAEPGTAVALFSATSPALVVVACGAGAGVDAGATLKALVAQFGGKGGGKPDLAQGGGLQGSSGALIAAARELLSR